MDTVIPHHTDFPNFPLAELHAHIAPAISPSIYWQLAHDQGFKLPKKDYHEFISHIVLSKNRKMKLNEYFAEIYDPLLHKLSSGTFAQERAFYETASGAYRNNIHLIEIRTNIMKSNNNGQQDLDHIIMAQLRGMEKAFLEYPKLSAGIIFCLAREFSVEKNSIMIEKAIKYHKRGIVGIDFAGPATKAFHYKDYKDVIRKAKNAGLKITAHAGELSETNDMWEALEYIEPQRIGHGIQAAYDKKLMKELSKRKTILEICPMSNIVTNAVENMQELKFILRTFIENDILFTINTDWPEMIEEGHLWRQFLMLRDEKILSEQELIKCNEIAWKAAFAPLGGLNAYL